MAVAICRNCGSTNIRADGALAGRLICNECGQPVSSNLNYKNQKSINRASFWGVNSYILIAFCVIIVLILL